MIGPGIPAHLLNNSQGRPGSDDNDSSDDDYVPALPPDMAPKSTTRRVMGPALPSHPQLSHSQVVSAPDSDDDVDGPMPLPSHLKEDDIDGVQEFIEREQRRQQNIAEMNKPKVAKRDEWMLVPPEASDLLGTLDPTKLRARQFSRNTEEKSKDRTLWTETPAERQQRLADEVMGKRKRPEGAPGSSRGSDLTAVDRKRLRRDEELKAQVDQHNKTNRGNTLVDLHQSSSSKQKPDDGQMPANIWDRDRDMAIGGRLMDESSRQKLLKDAKGLGDRFGHSSRGGYL